MIKPIVKDMILLSSPSTEATIDDKQVAIDLMDTLKANHEVCLGMAANMIGVRKRIIALSLIPFEMVMYNPVITKKEEPYEIEESCLSLVGERKTTRHKKIEVEYLDKDFKKQKQTFSGLHAEIIEHECDHLEGIII